MRHNQLEVILLPKQRFYGESAGPGLRDLLLPHERVKRMALAVALTHVVAYLIPRQTAEIVQPADDPALVDDG